MPSPPPLLRRAVVRPGAGMPSPPPLLRRAVEATVEVDLSASLVSTSSVVSVFFPAAVEDSSLLLVLCWLGGFAWLCENALCVERVLHHTTILICACLNNESFFSWFSWQVLELLLSFILKKDRHIQWRHFHKTENFSVCLKI